MNTPKQLLKATAVALVGASLITLASAEDDSQPTSLVQYGGMHETIGRKNHEARIDLSELLNRRHFYGVGALAELKGEISILDSKAVVTTVSADGKPSRLPGGKATLLVGQSVPAWNEVKIGKDITHEQIDETIRELAAINGINTSRPFLFMIEGECTEVRLHVINGACPMRARMKKEAIPDDQKPFEFETKTVNATVIGVYAQDSVGKLTHPDTAQHAHLIYYDPASEQRVTGHLETYGVQAGATLKLPKTSEQDSGGNG
jgi:alpha-acetolactate decarboxylase